MDNLYQIVGLPVFLLAGGAIQFLLNQIYDNDEQKNLYIIMMLFGLLMTMLSTYHVYVGASFLLLLLIATHIFTYAREVSRYLKFTMIFVVGWLLMALQHYSEIASQGVLLISSLYILCLPFRTTRFKERSVYDEIKTIHFILRLLLVFSFYAYSVPVLKVNSFICGAFVAYLVASLVFQKYYNKAAEEFLISIFSFAFLLLFKMDPFICSLVILYLYLADYRLKNQNTHNKHVLFMLTWLSPVGFKTAALFLLLSLVASQSLVNTLLLFIILVVGIAFSSFRPPSEEGVLEVEAKHVYFLKSLSLLLLALFIGGHYVAL